MGHKIESDSSVIRLSLLATRVVILFNVVGLASAQLPSEFQSSKDPVTDIFSLAQILKRSNENPGSQLTTVRVGREKIHTKHSLRHVIIFTCEIL